jgi:benzoyl-CoA reductase subunit C
MTTAPIFDGWQAESMDGLVARCRDLVEDLAFPTVERWRERGGKTVGHFQVYFPEEIAHAAGLLPVKVRGAQVEPQHADSHFGSYLCSILKTSLELHLSGRLKLDLFVSHPICDAARNLAAVWGRNAEYPCRLLMLPQNANSRHAASFLRGEYQALRLELEAIAGRRVSDEDLRRSLAVFNENRRLLRRLYALKREQPWLVAVEEAYVLAAVGGLIPREEHNALLWRALELIADRPARRQDKIRVVFAGGFCTSCRAPATWSRTTCWSACAGWRRTCASTAIRWRPSPRPISSTPPGARCSTTGASPRRRCSSTGCAAPAPTP